MDTVSLWKDITRTRPKFPSLTKDLTADVLIIGGGITGITCALELTRRGMKVVLLEAQSISGGTTGYSTGNLYVSTQPYYKEIVSKFDLDTARIVAQSRREAITFIEQQVNENNIDCSFMRRPWYIYASAEGKEDNSDHVKEEVDILQKCGIEIDFVDEMPIPVPFRIAAKMDDQARFNPFRYVVELSKIAASEGCLIFEDSRVTDFEFGSDDCCTATTKRGKVNAKYSIMATHTPLGFNILQALAAPYRSYVVAATLKTPAPNGNFWDVETPHHVTSSHPSKAGSKDLDLLMVAGSHHKVGQPDAEGGDTTIDHYKELEKYLHKYYDVESIAYRWSAQHYKAADSIPYIGKSPFHSERDFVATGFFADGLVYGSVAGMILPDLISGKENPWAEVYDSTRFTPISSAKEFIKENINEALQYMDYLGGTSEISEIKKGEGKIVSIDGRKCGVYRDKHNELHAVSAICTHMACILEFNNAEKSWDCPCHGSRYDIHGKQIEGPAMSELETKPCASILKEIK